ncbi:MAG: fructose-bisphosphate aldolase [Acidimicrobiales bacterium]|nr:MAG: fructose-bisphosphate aldolase [Acidimicrobiales bacterium]
MAAISRKLTLDDIADARAYERERPEFLRHVVSLKKKRRVQVGPFVSFVFENRDTIRFQIQEMARAERIYTDEGILHELETYNPLIPDPGTLSATMFIELTSTEELRHWLPRLVGIETKAELRIGEPAELVRCEVDPDHLKMLTREEATASVHFVRFRLDPRQIDAFERGPVTLAVTHDHYDHAAVLSAETIEELTKDLRG